MGRVRADKEDCLADLIARPHALWIVRIVNEAPREDLIAIAGWIEEIDRLAACDAMAGRANVERNVVSSDDIGGLADSCQDSSEKATW